MTSNLELFRITACSSSEQAGAIQKHKCPHTQTHTHIANDDGLFSSTVESGGCSEVAVQQMQKKQGVGSRDIKWNATELKVV